MSWSTHPTARSRGQHARAAGPSRPTTGLSKIKFLHRHPLFHQENQPGKWTKQEKVHLLQWGIPASGGRWAKWEAGVEEAVASRDKVSE